MPHDDPRLTFGGAKVAMIARGRVLTLLRDERADIPWPGHWDLPGGGREGDETPAACVLRELREETGQVLPPERLDEGRAYLTLGRWTWFYVVETAFRVRDLRLGAEGQALRMMPVRAFVRHPRAVPHLAERLAEHLGGS